MTKLGLCITPQYHTTSQEDNELNPSFYRSILYSLNDLNTLYNLGRPLLITLNNQCAEVRHDWSGWDNTVYQMCEWFKAHSLERLLLIEAGNELDLYWANGDASLSPEFAADLARRTARITHNYGIKAAPTPLAGSRWPEYLQIMADLCRNDVDYFGIHPYGQRPVGWYPPNWPGGQWIHGDLVNVIQHVKNVGGKPVVCSEEGVKIGDAGGESAVASFMEAAYTTLNDLDVPYAGWFCYNDYVDSPGEVDSQAFGLMDFHGHKRPAYDQFSVMNMGPSNGNGDDNMDEWIGKVGQGLLDMMALDGTTPAQRTSTWLPLGVTPSDIEECYGKNGTRYYWLLNENKGFRASAD